VALIGFDRLGLTLSTLLFCDLSLSIERGDRLGVVAANGRGKSSLLRCITGELEPGAGSITPARNLRLGLMTQDVPDDLRRARFAAAVADGLPAEGRDWETWRVDVLLDDLAVPAELRDRPLGDLSGGWQRTALFARAVVGEPDLLLLDEPTNHLDLTRMTDLERAIGRLGRDMAIVVVSHDRAFLDAVTNRTLFLRSRDSITFDLPYTPARAALAEVDAATARRYDTELDKAARLRRQAAKLKNLGVNSGSDLLTVKTRQLKARAERIEAAARPAGRSETAGRIRLGESEAIAKVLIGLDDLVVATPDGRRLYRTGRLWVSPGDRVVLLGDNGSGKSTLMRLLTAAATGTPCEGIRVAASVRPGIADQSLSHLVPGETPREALARRFALSETRIRALLAEAGFTPEQQAAPTGGLSGGQRTRLAMVILRLTEPDLHLLDEPTNHLDIDGQEALERELAAGEGAAVLVSHDRRFVETVGNRFWLIERGRLVEVVSPHAFFAR
jgi:ATPase subunit of ABC transporter with duplicated ATPase domains